MKALKDITGLESQSLRNEVAHFSDVYEEDVPFSDLMGVPITFMSHYCPNQFEIVGHEHDLFGNSDVGIKEGQFLVNGKGKYKRILIRRKHTS